MKTIKPKLQLRLYKKMCTKINQGDFTNIKLFLHKQNDVFQTMKNNFVEEVCYV